MGGEAESRRAGAKAGSKDRRREKTSERSVREKGAHGKGGPRVGVFSTREGCV